MVWLLPFYKERLDSCIPLAGGTGLLPSLVTARWLPQSQEGPGRGDCKDSAGSENAKEEAKVTGARRWDSPAVPHPSCMALGDHLLSLKLSPCLKHGASSYVQSQHWKNVNGGNGPHIHLYNASQCTKQINCITLSDSHEEGGTPAVSLLDSAYRRGCLCTFTLGQLYHSLQTGIGFLTHFTFQETVTLGGSGRAELIFDPKTISWQITRYFPSSRPSPSSSVTLGVFPIPLTSWSLWD